MKEDMSEKTIMQLAEELNSDTLKKTKVEKVAHLIARKESVILEFSKRMSLIDEAMLKVTTAITTADLNEITSNMYF